MSTVLQRSATLQEQLRQILTERIAGGEYAPGAEFPSETVLAQEFELSRATVRSALSALVAEGLLVRRRGVGTLVSQRPVISDPIGEALDFRELIASNGFEVDVATSLACIVQADPDLAADLNLEPGADLQRMEVVFSADGSPVIYCSNALPTSVLSEELIAQVLQDPQSSEPIYEFLEKRCGQRIDYHLASLWAATSDGFIMPITCCPPGTPMLVMKSIAYSAEGNPVFLSLSAYPDPRIKFTLLRKHKPA